VSIGAAPAIRRRTRLLFVLAAAGVAALLAARALLFDPSVVLLARRAGAAWIRFPAPFVLESWLHPEDAVFRTRFALERAPAEARLHIRALEVFAVQLDGHPLGAPQTEPRRWKQEFELDLAPALAPGVHELRIQVRRVMGHAALRARAPALGLYSGSDWEASLDGGRSFRPAVEVDARVEVALARELPSAPAALLRLAPFLVVVFGAVFLWTLLRTEPARATLGPRASHVRLFLLAAWTLLALNNLGRLPTALGFDYPQHLDYLVYVVERARLPLAHEGWQMFQAPLYYVLWAALERTSAALVLDADPTTLGRLVSFACGLALVELGYRTQACVFPGREDLQAIGTWVSGLLPMSLYICQLTGNEPLSGVASAAVMLLCLRGLVAGSSSRPLRAAAAIGSALGLALLAKASAVILIPFVAMQPLVTGGSALRTRAARAALSLATALLVAGWYYARNVIEYGKPIVGGWDPVRRILWWQDPSYRIPENLTRFGEALVRPVYAGIHGIWDGLYASLWADGLLSGMTHLPPWNTTFMLAGVWLAVPVTLLVALGLAWPLSGAARRAQLFAAAVFASYLAALLHLYLTVPHYSAVKATYTLGLAPCYGLFAAAGARPLVENRWLRATLFGLLACAGSAAYAAYFVL
jgi:hypothetical protein